MDALWAGKPLGYSDKSLEQLSWSLLKPLIIINQSIDHIVIVQNSKQNVGVPSSCLTHLRFL